MTLALVMVVFMPSMAATAFVLFAFFFAYYIYEPPYRGLYPDLLPQAVFGRAQIHGRAIRAARPSNKFGRCAWPREPPRLTSRRRRRS